MEMFVLVEMLMPVMGFLKCVAKKMIGWKFVDGPSAATMQKLLVGKVDLLMVCCKINVCNKPLKWNRTALSYDTRFARPRMDTEFGLYSCTGNESSLLDCPPDTFWQNFDGCDTWRISIECSELKGIYNYTDTAHAHLCNMHA